MAVTGVTEIQEVQRWAGPHHAADRVGLGCSAPPPLAWNFLPHGYKTAAPPPGIEAEFQAGGSGAPERQPSVMPEVVYFLSGNR